MLMRKTRCLLSPIEGEQLSIVDLLVSITEILTEGPGIDG